MAKRIYIGAGGTARRVKKAYIGMGGVARRIKKAYIGVGGVARPIYSTELEYWGEAAALGSSGVCGVTATANSKYALFAGGGIQYTYKKVSSVTSYTTSLTKTMAPALDNTYDSPMTAVSLDKVSLFAERAGNGRYDSTGIISAYDLSLTKSSPAKQNENNTRYGMCGVRIGNYAAFVSGGIRGRVNVEGVTTIDTYDESLTYSVKSPCYGRTHHTGAFNGTHAIIAGGVIYWDNTGFNAWGTDEVEALDTSFTRTILDSLSEKRGEMGTARVGNYVLFMGGTNVSGESTQTGYNDVILDTVDAYNSSLTRTTAPALSNKYNAAGFVTGLHNKYALAAPDKKDTNVDVYDSALTKTTPFKLPNYGAAATTIEDYALFAGGISSKTALYTSAVSVVSYTP